MDEIYKKLCDTLTDFGNSTDDPEDADYLSDGEWLDVFYDLCVRMKNEMEIEMEEWRMREVCVNVTETSYGYVVLEVDDNATDEEILEMAKAEAQNGNANWCVTDCTANDIQE